MFGVMTNKANLDKTVKRKYIKLQKLAYLDLLANFLNFVLEYKNYHAEKTIQAFYLKKVCYTCVEATKVRK